MKKCIILIMLSSFLKSTAQQAVLQVNENVQMNLSGAVQMTLSEGALRNEGIFNAGLGSTVNFLGTTGKLSGTQQLAQTIFHDLKINVTDEVEVSQDITVSHQVLFSSGLLLLDHATVTLEGNLAQENELSRIWSMDSDSYVTIQELYNTPAAQNSGNMGLAITAAGDIGPAALRRYHIPVTANGHAGIQRYFDFIPANPGVYPGTLRFYYFDAELNAHTEQMLNLWHSPDGLSWTNMGQQLASALDNYIEQEVANLSGYWTVADIDHPLPLDLITFSAVCTGDRIRVNWTTAALAGPMVFLLERSENGNQWEEIGRLSAQPEDEPTFVLEDDTPLIQGLYRIRMSDQYDRMTYSPVFPGGCEDRLISSSVWPVPATDRLYLGLQAVRSGALTWRMLTVDGRLVQEGTRTYQEGSNSCYFDVSGIAAGSYLLHINLATERMPQVFKFIKN